MIPTFTALGTGPTVVMLHGIGGDHRAFAPQVEALAQAGYRAVAWNMPGYGDSAPIDPYTFKGLAQSCIALIEALMAGQDDASVTLLGHSMGGMVAQEVVARRPDLVSHLILAGTSAAFGRTSGGQVATQWQHDFVTQRTAPLDAGQSMADVANTLVPQMTGPGALPAGVALAISCMGEGSPVTYRSALQALVTFDRSANLPRISVPTLLVAGEFDKSASPAVMKKMAKTIPQGLYRELANVGHLLNLEAPNEFDGAVLDFLAATRK
jgi:pimeloyl-ACP methyl ester carboxylesterase